MYMYICMHVCEYSYYMYTYVLCTCTYCTCIVHIIGLYRLRACVYVHCTVYYIYKVGATMSFNRFGLETASNLIPPFHSSGTTSTVSRPPSYAGLSVGFMHLSLNCTSPVGEGWGFNPPECHPRNSNGSPK